MTETEAIECIRIALQAQEHESLGDAAQRVIAEYLTAPGAVDRERSTMHGFLVERAIVAYSLRLDLARDERLMKWVHVFDAAQIAKLLLERIEQLTCECGHQHHGACAESGCECIGFVRFAETESTAAEPEVQS